MKRPEPTKTTPARPGSKVKIDWCQLKRDALQGTSRAALARKYGVSMRTISEREKREDWPTPARLEKVANQVASMRDAIGDNFSIFNDLEALNTEISKGADDPAAYITLLQKICKSSLLHFGATVPIPRTWRDAEIADRMARRAYGLDNQQVAQATQINVNVLRMDADPVVEVSDSVG